ncbi:cytochrome P450 [Coniella lustricola]|uniref:Bifunctional cytochrome P450/NADPH--P450 reductase n=1 Tax=Coniella lustricola TaxID=2025994 RepID=A0A2T3A638_9PEZI|nr:cytochrome P450 [Coniella lustricola]
MATEYPGPKGYPFIGNIFDVDPTSPVASLEKIAERYGPIFKLRFAGMDRIFIANRELMDEVCDEKRFTKIVAGPQLQLRNCVGDSLFTAHSDEPNWGLAHRILMPAMGPLAIRGMFDEMHDLASQLVTKWARFGSQEVIDVSADFTRLTLDTIALCSMGTRFNSFYTDEMHPFVGAMLGALQESGRRAPRPAWANHLLPAATAQYEEDIRTLTETATELLAARRANPSKKKDILNTLINGRDPKTGEKMSDKSILNNMVVFLIAGHETTSGLLSFLFHYFLKHPLVFQTAQGEVDRVVGRKAITIEHLSKLPYLEACLRETLRLHPTAPVTLLKPHPDLPGFATTLARGQYEIRKDQAIACLLTPIQRDPAVYGADANEFRAERMLDENFVKLPKNSWKPFGNGLRGCIGRAFAWQESLLVLAMLLQNFNFELYDPSSTYELQIKQTLTLKPGNLFMRAAVREHVDTVKLGSILHGHNGSDTTHNHKETIPLTPPSTGSSGNRSAITFPAQSTTSQLMRILYGSESGTCEAIAHALASIAQKRGYDTTVSPLDAAVDDLLPRKDPAETSAETLVLISSSYNGQPPANAARFVSWLESLPSSSPSPEGQPLPLDGVQYAVYGCGNHDYGATFHRIPRLLDATLEASGASRIAPIGLSDVISGDVFDEFDQWQQEHLWPALNSLSIMCSVTLNNGQLTPPYNHDAISISKEAVTPQPSLAVDCKTRFRDLRQEDMRQAVVLSNEVLTADGTAPQKRLMVLELPEGVTYGAGDHVNILPVNDWNLVRRVLNWAKLPWDAVLKVPDGDLPATNMLLPTPRPASVVDLLAGYVELGLPATQKDLKTLSLFAPDQETKDQILSMHQNLATATTTTRSHRPSILDILESFPSLHSFPFESLLSMLPPLRPRRYSVASSPKSDASRVALLWTVVDSSGSDSVPTSQPPSIQRRWFRGVASNFLASLQPGESLQMNIRPALHLFRPPTEVEAHSTPIIMICAGSGLAPFRAFLQERTELMRRMRSADDRRPLAPAYLFIGCRRPDADRLLAEELAMWAENSNVQMFYAFSQDPSQSSGCKYVQDRVWKEREVVTKHVMNGPGRIYVCGGTGMGKGVDECLKTIYSGVMGRGIGDKDVEAADRWVDELKTSRYAREIFE